MNFLSRREPREKALIGVAALLIAVMGLWQFMLKPVLDLKQTAETKQATALRDYSMVQQAAPLLAISGSPQMGKQPFDRAALISMSAANSVTISRLQPAPNDSLQVWFEVNTPPQILTLLSQLQSSYAVEITRVQMNRRDNNIVSAQVTFMPSTAAKR